MKNNFLIVIPVYNEEKNISKFISRLKRTTYDFIVVNDGSTDNTLSKLDYCIGYTKNKGKGYAIKFGAKYAISKGYDWILIMDGDGQMSIDDIKQFESVLNMPCYYNVKLILGNRMHNNSTMPLIRKITNYIMSYIISKVANTYIADSQCGFRAIHKDIFKLNLKTTKFDFESEMLIKAGVKKFKIVNVPIKSIYFKNRKSKINIFKDTLNFIKLITKTN